MGLTPIGPHHFTNLLYEVLEYSYEGQVDTEPRQILGVGIKVIQSSCSKRIFLVLKLFLMGSHASKNI